MIQIQSWLRRTTTLDSQAAARLAARAALEKHAEAVVVMDVRGLSTVADFFVIGTAGSTRQLTALKEHLEDVLEQHGYPVSHTEGTPEPLDTSRSGTNHVPQWVLMDCGDLIVHLFDEPARDFYRLEDLWADAPRLSLEPQ